MTDDLLERYAGTNESAIHWDLVKDLHSGGRIELDGNVAQEDGVCAAEAG